MKFVAKRINRRLPLSMFSRHCSFQWVVFIGNSRTESQHMEGTEKGTYYALHLGGIYFRILRVHLGGERSYLDVQDVERHPTPSHLMNRTSEVFPTFSSFPWKGLSKKKETGPIHKVLKRNWHLRFCSMSNIRLYL